MKTCETCVFADFKDKKTGICRRYPPVAKGFQCITTKDQWCGEHKAKLVLTPARKR